MDLKKEILLCFSEEDNQPIEGGLKGWISNFHKFLSTLLSQISRESPEVRMVSESDFDKIKLDNATVVILVCTPALMKNTDFIATLNNYGKSLLNDDSLTLDGVPRVFKVHKLPFEDEIYLPQFQNLISYDFYMVDPLTGESQEFKRFFGTDAERSYWMKLVDMAYDINHILSFHRAHKARNETSEVPREKTVYLASTGVDMVIQRDIIKRELIRHGYKVLPQHTLPKEVNALEYMVREDLHKCRLTIHMVAED